MNLQKIVFTTAFLGIFAGGFFVNAQPAQAATVEELQALIAQLKAQILQLQQQLAATQGQPAAWCHDFNTNIRLGNSGDEVYALQSVLLKEGLFGESDETSDKTFGEQTASAVVGFQQKYASEILAPFGLKFGTGFVGKGTRAKLNALYGCAAAQIPAPPPIPTPIPIPLIPPLTYTPKSVAPSITVLSPNGGEKWAIDSAQTIKWSIGGGLTINTISVEVYLPREDGTWLWQPLVENLNNTGYYMWNLKTDGRLIQGSNYKIRVKGITSSGVAVQDESDNYFSIVGSTTTQPFIKVLSPLQGDQWAIGSSQAIKWSASSNIKEVVISLSPAVSTLRWSSIAPPLATSGSYGWIVDTQGREIGPYVLRICGYVTIYAALDEPAICVQSQTFSIVDKVSTQPSITVLSPNGGEKLATGQSHIISWKLLNPIAFSSLDKIKVAVTDYSTTPMTGYDLAYNLPPASPDSPSSKYEWTIPSSYILSGKNNLKVEVELCGPGIPSLGAYSTSSAGINCIRDESDNYFSIVTAPSVSSFNYTETDAYSGSVKFYWTSTGADSVEFQIPCYANLSIQDAVSGANLLCGDIDRTFPPNTSTYLKFTNTSGVLINATATLTPVIGGAGYGAYSKTLNFSITPATTASITVLSPNGGEQWVFGNTYTITWQSSGVQTAYVYLQFPDGGMCKITQGYAQYGNIGFAPQKDMQCPGISRTLTAGQYKVAIYGESETVKDFSDNYFSIVSAVTPSSLRSIEDQTASIADAVSRLLQSFEEFKKSNP